MKQKNNQKWIADFAMRFKSIREEEGLSQKQYSEALGISTPTVCRLEKGQATPDAKLILRIVEIYKCDLTWLMTGEGSPSGDIGEAEKRRLLAQVKKDPEFRASVLSELGLRPSSGVARNERIYNLLSAQRSDWQEIVECTIRSVEGVSSVEKSEAAERVKAYREGIAYLDVLLEVGRAPGE